MEFKNRIELRGVVGKADVNTVNGSRVCNFSVVTEYNAGRDKETNGSVNETHWFNVVAWDGRNSLPLEQIRKGEWVEVIGRLRTRHYRNQNEEERYITEVVARSVKLVPKEEERIQPQRDW